MISIFQCFIIFYAECDAIFQASRKYYTGTRLLLPQNQKSRDNTPDITEYKDLVSQKEGPFKQDFGGYPYIREMFPTR
ncbi:hypothetical protein HanRHA438_Chr17g0835421 [Helianthus annuus]|nr:hypothetical protein HanRHA438_Chr17g0835421 [Helianthus annuus]